MALPSTLIDAGRLNRRVKLQQRVATVDAEGQQSTQWVDVVNTWASIEPASGREVLMGQAIQAEVTHTVTIRYRQGVTAAMRLVYQAELPYNIQSVIDVDTRHIAMVLLCSQGLTPAG